MKHRATILWFLFAVVAGAFSIVVNTEVQKREDRIAWLNRNIAANQEAINLLRAEWSYLNHPDRLETLARRHLDLQPPAQDQIVPISALPFAGTGDDESPRSIGGTERRR